MRPAKLWRRLRLRLLLLLLRPHCGRLVCGPNERLLLRGALIWPEQLVRLLLRLRLRLPTLLLLLRLSCRKPEAGSWLRAGGLLSLAPVARGSIARCVRVCATVELKEVAFHSSLEHLSLEQEHLVLCWRRRRRRRRRFERRQEGLIDWLVVVAAECCFCNAA